jgi:hypothetical protein
MTILTEGKLDDIRLHNGAPNNEGMNWIFIIIS